MIAHRIRRWVWGSAGVAAFLALVVFVPRFGFTKDRVSLWTDRPVPVTTAAPAAAPRWVELAKALKPAVVNISTKRVQDGGPAPGTPFGDADPFNQFFKQFFGSQPRRTVRSLGSGFLINAEGAIVTNNHVVDGASEIRVRLSDGREFPGRVLGRDPRTDLALVKIDATGLPLVPLGDSAELQVGEPVMAIGNPFGLEQTVTTGIVSATGRVIGEGPYDDFIETDASINPGNSGGPLLNARGQAIGINAAIFTQSGGSVGIGFAIPINLAKPVLSQLATSGRVVRGWLGVTIQRVTADLAKGFDLGEARGALVTSVAEGSPAMAAGVTPGDVIVEYDGHRIARSDDLPRLVAETPVGRRVPLTVLRDAKPLALGVTIARLDEPAALAATEPAAGPTLGAALETLTPRLAQQLGLPHRHGVLVRGVQDGSPAANAGLRPGDVIAEIDRHPVTTVQDVTQALGKRAPGTPTLFLVHRRDGSSLYLTMSS